MSTKMKKDLIIRKASYIDIADLMTLYENAKVFMRKNGNYNQWTGGYPSEPILKRDIENENLYIVENSKNVLIGAFVFILGDDPTYSYIEGGKWLNDQPYGTIHRIASAGLINKFTDYCIDFCSSIISNLRIDTHSDNKPMIEAIKRNGFIYCGVIYLADGSPRLAFQRNLHNEL